MAAYGENALIFRDVSVILSVQFSMIAATIEQIRDRIARRCTTAGRDPSDVTLLAVTKTFPADRVQAVVRSGVLDIGENYVQELLLKRAALNDDRLRWHFIGHLQSNKVRQIIDWVSLIHAVDSVSLATEIDARAARARRIVDVLLEVNTTGESSKFGLRPAATPGFVKQIEGFSHLRVAGLMTIGPFLPDPEGSRPMFRELRLLRDELATLSQENVAMKHLSMGMSGDYEVAIDEGATIVRLGTALFGSRTQPH
jgi:pyridoxal phosphate enzyme (YggS family)